MAATGRSRSGIDTCLKNLERVGLIERDRSKVRALNVTAEDVDRVALTMRTDGERESRLRLYASQRPDDTSEVGSDQDGLQTPAEGTTAVSDGSHDVVTIARTEPAEEVAA